MKDRVNRKSFYEHLIEKMKMCMLTLDTLIITI